MFSTYRGINLYFVGIVRVESDLGETVCNVFIRNGIPFSSRFEHGIIHVESSYVSVELKSIYRTEYPEAKLILNIRVSFTYNEHVKYRVLSIVREIVNVLRSLRFRLVGFDSCIHARAL